MNAKLERKYQFPVSVLMCVLLSGAKGGCGNDEAKTDEGVQGGGTGGMQGGSGGSGGSTTTVTCDEFFECICGSAEPTPDEDEDCTGFRGVIDSHRQNYGDAAADMYCAQLIAMQPAAAEQCGLGGSGGTGGQTTGGSSGSTGKGGSSGSSGSGGDTPALGDPYPNWPMPNPPASGLPNPQSYDVSEPEVVLDEVTGLIWQRTHDATQFTWEEARAHCEDLTLGGADDWRVPSRIELISIVNVTTADPAIDSSVFTDSTVNPSLSGLFWTSSLFIELDSAWSVRFTTGMFVRQTLNLQGFVRCVRGGGTAPSTRYVVEGEIVTDAATGLVWQRIVEPDTHDPAAAATYCEGLAIDGGGWRLPSVGELATLVDDRIREPAIDREVFPDTPSEWFWTPHAAIEESEQDFTWAVSFVRGSFRAMDNRDRYPVRCVR